MFGLGPTELIIIAVIVLLIFGAKRLPEIGKGLGGAIREFKNVKEELSTKKTADEEQDPDNTSTKKEGSSPTLGAKVADKVLEQVPGVKKAMDIKKKAEKIKELVK
ncbi:MAG: twin-arginine translocase TatA/TatE family subunit [Deltaproteobacteria bacterium]|nr:twin-arginine translocase TatA/TatE family subunit [Deltaproteobacteria bacterium]